MHILTRHIVYAENKEEARDKAENNALNMSGENRSFDWFNLDPDRYEDAGSVHLVTSEKGKELIDEGMKWTLEEAKRNYDKVKEIMDTKSFEEIMSDRMSRYYFYCFGKYDGGDVWLYDNDGEGIRDKGHLDDVLTKWGDKTKDKLSIYVVPIDMHF